MSVPIFLEKKSTVEDFGENSRTIFFSFILAAGFSTVNSVSAHACLPVSVCRSHLPFPASSHVPFIPFRPALSMDLGACRATRHREAPPHAKVFVRIEMRD